MDKKIVRGAKDWHKEYGLPDEYEDEGYLEEQLVSKMKTSLQISSYCNARCVFCCNKMGPLVTQVKPFRSIDSIKRGLDLIDGTYDDIIRLILFRRLSEGEAILHPKLLEILQLIRDRFPNHAIQIETNGSTLKEPLIKELVKFNPIIICLTYHSHNAENWSKLVGLPKELHENPKQAFILGRKYGLQIEPSIPPMPNIVGWNDIKKTIAYISLFKKDLDLTFSSYTKELPEDVKERLQCDPDDFAQFVSKMKAKYKIEISCDLDLGKKLKFYPRHLIKNTEERGFKHVAWLMSENAAKRAQTIINRESFTNKQYIKMVKNISFGGNVITSGILQVEDFKEAILELCEELGFTPDLFLVPSVCFDLKDNDLSGVNYKTIEKEFGTTVWIVADQKSYDEYRINQNLSAKEKLRMQTYLPYEEKDQPPQTYSEDFL